MIGHESLGIVGGAAGQRRQRRRSRRRHRAPARSGSVSACAVGEWDMCRNGLYTERGIKERNGFGAELFRVEPDFLVKVDPVTRHCRRAARTDQRGRQGLGSHRAHRPALAIMAATTLLVTGAGPVGLLAALIGVQRGLDVHVLDHNEIATSESWCSRLGGIRITSEIAYLRLSPIS